MIENYGAYAGANRLDLSVRPGRPVVLIGGLNGAGKSTILESIMVAMYGRAYLGRRATAKEYDRFILSRIHRGRGGGGAPFFMTALLDSQ